MFEIKAVAANVIGPTLLIDPSGHANKTLVKVAGANMSVAFFPDDMTGNTEMKVDTTNNHPALTSYFANPSLKKQSFWKSPTS